jgi:hypothetical protein
MMRLLFALWIALFSLSSAQALELSWRGRAVGVSSSGCTAFNGMGKDWFAFLWPPLTGTTNTSASTFTIRSGGSSEGFHLKSDGNFTAMFKPVRGVHIGTGVGVYDAQIRLLDQVPATITAASPRITGRLQVKGFNSDGACLVTFRFALSRHVDHR